MLVFILQSVNKKKKNIKLYLLKRTLFQKSEIGRKTLKCFVNKIKKHTDKGMT